MDQIEQLEISVVIMSIMAVVFLFLWLSSLAEYYSGNDGEDDRDC